MREHRVETQEAPAKRLVLFVGTSQPPRRTAASNANAGDGLRADKTFQSFPNPDPNATTPNTPQLIADYAKTPRPLAPFLRSKVLEEGTFGVSHTRVPTESRPGHVALIAGLYEDVSAVATGWKLNPVNFDSVFNRSRHTWSWGSPDILPMFETGAVPGRVDAYCYGHDFEDFSKDAWILDEWVFERVKGLFEAAKTNATLNSELRKEKNVFFLHLLGLDTAGHAHRPYSWQYLHNIQIVDRGVQEITKLIEEFYDDDQTAFVFTADHGMSDWGSHGDGNPDNTRTPLIAWGAGVAKPVKAVDAKADGHEDGFSHDWNLDHIQRNDVDQADVAALMAYLLGLDFPTNSVGVLPLTYLDKSDKEKAEALLVNAKEILEMYRVKEETKRAHALYYKPFPGLGDEQHSIEYRTIRIQKAIDAGQYEEAVNRTYDIIDLGLDGLRYLQTYDWLFLRALITLGYLGWIAFAITTVLDLHVLNEDSEAQRTMQSTVAFSSVLVLLYSVLLKQRSPLWYYAYAIFPVFFWEEVYARRSSIVRGGRVLFSQVNTFGDKVRLVLATLGSLGLLQALVQSYFHREIYTICYLLATTWPTFYGQEFAKKNIGTVATWIFSCMMMSAFTLLPANKAENVPLIMTGGGLMFAVGAFYLAFEEKILASGKSHTSAADAKNSLYSRLILSVQLGLVALSMIVTNSSIYYVQARQGLPLGVLVVGWATLGKFPHHTYCEKLLICSSGLAVAPKLAWSVPQQPLHPPPGRHVPAIRANLHHPQYLLRRPLLLRLLHVPVQLDAPGASSLPSHRLYTCRYSTATLLHHPCRRSSRRPPASPRTHNRVPLTHTRRRSHRAVLLLLHPIRILQRLKHRLRILLLPRRRIPPDPCVRSIQPRRFAHTQAHGALCSAVCELRPAEPPLGCRAECALHGRHGGQ
jgi:phosphatidylinositol glycan class N